MSAAGACAECGFDPSSLTVEDAIVTLRSLPRRWRELAERVEDDDPGAAATYRQRAERAAGLESVAADAERCDAESWNESGRLAALFDAVHDGVHELRLAERSVD